MDVVTPARRVPLVAIALAALMACLALLAGPRHATAQVGTPVSSLAPLAADTPVLPLLGPPATWGQVGDAQRPRLLLFATIWCASCRAEVPHVVEWAEAHVGEADVVYVFSGSEPARVAEAVAEYGPSSEHVTVLVDEEGALARHFGVRATPTLLWWDDPAQQARQLAGLEEIELAARPTAERLAVADSGHELGTSYDVVLIVPEADEERARAHLAEARTLVRELESRFTEWRDDSEISELNAAIARGEGLAGISVAPDLAQLIAGALHVSGVSGGAFDPTWRPLGRLWERAAEAGSEPSGDAIAEASSHIGGEHVRVDGTQVFVDDAAVELGLEGVAKGWIVDAVFEFLRRSGYDDLIVNIGGDLRTAGRDLDGQPQLLRLLDPYEPERVLRLLEIEDTAVATSGNYFRARDVGGRRVGHVLDPRDGQPAAFDGSVTVLTRDAAMADALATALLVLGPDAGLRLVARLEHVEALYATREGLRSSLDGGP